MQKIKIIAVGKLTEKNYSAMSDEYLKRAGRSFAVSVVEVRPSPLPQDPGPGDIEKALAREAELISSEIPPRSTVVAMCVEGKKMSSDALAEYITKTAQSGKPDLCFIIGSSHGLHGSVKEKADLRLSASDMTFPHELFRVMLLEQIYRAGEILSGGKYHK